MGTYLVVTHQTARCRELIDGLLQKVSADPEAAFALLIPATPPEHLANPNGDDRQLIAGDAALEAWIEMRAAGLRVTRTLVGDPYPLSAIGEELLRSPNSYDGIILCTLPTEESRWLRMDLPQQVESMFHLPVTHILAARRPAEASMADQPGSRPAQEKRR